MGKGEKRAQAPSSTWGGHHGNGEDSHSVLLERKRDGLEKEPLSVNKTRYERGVKRRGKKGWNIWGGSFPGVTVSDFRISRKKISITKNQGQGQWAARGVKRYGRLRAQEETNSIGER